MLLYFISFLSEINMYVCNSSECQCMRLIASKRPYYWHVSSGSTLNNKNQVIQYYGVCGLDYIHCKNCEVYFYVNSINDRPKSMFVVLSLL